MRTRPLKALATVALTVLLGGFLAATLVRYSPGFGVDERELDPRFNEGSIRRIREETPQDREPVLPYYFHYLARAARGDLGVSAGFRRPVQELIAERLPETARSAGAGPGIWMDPRHAGGHRRSLGGAAGLRPADQRRCSFVPMPALLGPGPGLRSGWQAG